jgi:hypothetical protein
VRRPEPAISDDDQENEEDLCVARDMLMTARQLTPYCVDIASELGDVFCSSKLYNVLVPPRAARKMLDGCPSGAIYIGPGDDERRDTTLLKFLRARTSGASSHPFPRPAAAAHIASLALHHHSGRALLCRALRVSVPARPSLITWAIEHCH